MNFVVRLIEFLRPMPRWNHWSKPMKTYGGKYVQIRFRIKDNLMESRKCLDEIGISDSQFDENVNKCMDPLFKVNYK